MKKVLVSGTFDILHEGHLEMLKQARVLGDQLVVVVARDETVRQVKGEYPWNDQDVRREAVEDTGLADKVRLGNSGDKHIVIEEEKPDIIALGYDQTFFTEELEKKFSNIRIVRLVAYKPGIFKSTLLKAEIMKG